MSSKFVFKEYRIQTVYSLIGAIAGHLFLHPYTMLVYFMMDRYKGKKTTFHAIDFFNIAFTVFNPEMFPMVVAFTLFGGVVGLLIGVLIDRKRRLYILERENEKRKIEVETLQRLMVTLSHYLLNASAVIGGNAHRIHKFKAKNDIITSLEIIEKQAEKIDAVISALRKLSEIKTVNYTAGGQDLLLDIAEEIEELLKNKTF